MTFHALHIYHGAQYLLISVHVGMQSRPLVIVKKILGAPQLANQLTFLLHGF